MVPSVRIVDETGKPVAQIARDLGVNEGTLGDWVNRGSGRPFEHLTVSAPSR